MKLLNDERAENPIEVGLYVLLVIAVMAFMYLGFGAFLDAFESEINILSTSNPLSSWGTSVLAIYMNYVNYAFYVPSIFITIILIWGVRAVIRKHTYTTTQDQQFNNPDEF